MKGNAAAQPSCVLAMLGQERLRGALPGLVLTDDGPVPAPGQLSCCGGRGIRFDADVSEAKRCDVRRRIERVRKLMYALRVVSEGKRDLAQEAASCDAVHLNAAVRRFAATARRDCDRGLAIPIGPEAVQPDGKRSVSLWALAAAGIWRFGLDVQVLVLGRQSKGNFPAFLTGAQAPQILMVEGVDRLWDPLLADEFEALVGYAYKSMLPLWIELVVRTGKGASDPASGEGAKSSVASRPGLTAHAWKKRLQSLRSQPPLHWLEADARSKLPDLCDGVRPFIAETPKARRHPEHFP